MNPLGLIAVVIMSLLSKVRAFMAVMKRDTKKRLINILPRIIKRMTLVVTLYLKGRNEKIFEDIQMSDLNKRLLLANDEVVLEYLVKFNNKCDWYPFTLQGIIDKDACQLDAKLDGALAIEMSRDIVRKVPSWLTYGTEQDMVQDISCLLMKVPVSKCACST